MRKTYDKYEYDKLIKRNLEFEMLCCKYLYAFNDLLAIKLESNINMMCNSVVNMSVVAVMFRNVRLTVTLENSNILSRKQNVVSPSLFLKNYIAW